MKQTRALMGMTISVEIANASGTKTDIDKVFSYFENVENKLSVFKTTSEITLINNGKIKESQWSEDMKLVFALAKKTKKETNGYFDIVATDGKYNPSGLVKGWAIYNASKLLLAQEFKDFYVEAGGDVQAHGKNERGRYWSVGIKNPFNQEQIIKILYLKNQGIATSGTYLRGQHIYDPHTRYKPLTEIVSISVIGPNVYEADRFATAAFAMGEKGIRFIENLKGFEGYMIDKNGIGTETSGFEKYNIYDENV
jgi:FAD:protein FMN transferase